MAHSALRCALWTALLTWLLCAGCASTPSSSRALGGPGEHIGVQMYMRGEGAQFAKWAVNRDGVLRFAGGYQAELGQWSWKGRLTSAQSDAIDTIVRDARWLSGVPVVGNSIVHEASDAPPKVWQVRVAGASSDRAFEVIGPNPAVLAVWSVFEQAGKARFSGELNRLPQGDLDRYMRERRVQEQAGQQIAEQERE